MFLINIEYKNYREDFLVSVLKVDRLSENVVETSQKMRVESDENIDLWFHYFNEKIDKETIYEAVYSLTEKEFKNKI